MKRTFRFADFELDTAAGALRRGVQTLPVTPKIYTLLLALVERPGELVTKEELMARLWPDTAVGRPTSPSPCRRSASSSASNRRT